MPEKIESDIKTSLFLVLQVAIGGKVPASKFIYLDGSSFAACILYGYEA